VATAGLDEAHVTDDVIFAVDPSLKSPVAESCSEEATAMLGLDAVTETERSTLEKVDWFADPQPATDNKETRKTKAKILVRQRNTYMLALGKPWSPN